MVVVGWWVGPAPGKAEREEPLTVASREHRCGAKVYTLPESLLRGEGEGTEAEEGAARITYLFIFVPRLWHRN